MSMCNCKDCGAYIDSDDDPDCFVEVGNMRRLHETVILCERCRDEREAQQNAQEDAADRCIAEMEKTTGEQRP